MTLRRREVVSQLLKDRGQLLVIAGLGSTAWDITAAGDTDLSFPLWGAMGANLTVVVIDNERYGETGMQRTHTAFGVDLAAVATACKFKRAITATKDVAAVRELVYKAPGPNFAAVKVADEKLALVLPPNDGVLLKARFRCALLGESADVLPKKP